MSQTSPLFALNVMMLTFDNYYFIRDTDVGKSQDLQEFIQSGSWTHDEAANGWTCPRIPIIDVVPEAEIATQPAPTYEEHAAANPVVESTEEGTPVPFEDGTPPVTNV